MSDDSEIGMKALHEGVPVPKELELDSVIINPHFVIQEMPPATRDSRGRKGAAVRIKVTDNYVEIRLRRSGERIRAYFNH